MKSRAGPDADVSFAYLNTAIAGFQGSLAARNALETLGYDCSKLHSSSDMKECLDWLLERQDELWAGRPPVRAAGKPDPLETTLFGFFDLLKRDTAGLVVSLIESLNAIQSGPDAAGARFVAAAIARHAASRQHYIAGIVKFGSVFGAEDLAGRWRRQLDACRTELAEADGFLGKLRSGAPLDHALRFELWNRAANLPGVFKSRLNDMMAIEGLRGRPHSYDALGISAEDAEAWEKLGFPPEKAGYWWSFGFGPNEAELWIKAGIPDGGYAGAWTVRGFSLEAAQEWRKAGLHPGDAYEFVAAGCKSPESARAMLRELKGGQADPPPKKGRP